MLVKVAVEIKLMITKFAFESFFLVGDNRSSLLVHLQTVLPQLRMNVEFLVARAAFVIWG